MFENLQVEPCYDAKVVGTTTKRDKQIWIFVLVGVGNGSVRKDHFEISHIIAHPTFLRSKVRYTSSYGETSNTDTRSSAAGRAQAQRIEFRVDFTPSGTRANRNNIVIFVKLDKIKSS